MAVELVECGVWQEISAPVAVHEQAHCHGAVATDHSHAMSAFHDKLHPSNAAKFHTSIPC